MLLVLAAAGVLLGVLGYVRFQRHNFKRFRAVRPGVLYRMGQPSEYGLRSIARDPAVKTVLCLRRASPRLKAGVLYDAGEPSGPLEADLAAELGIRFVHWPLGEEVYWPWPTPWNFEQFYRLFDDPANFPVVVHCRAGKHRAGTMAALFRLEYDRWDPERALAELYSFGFGPPQAVQEHNLRTYLPRPRPDAGQWNALLAALSAPLGNPLPADYDELVRRLRADRDRPAVRAALEGCLADGRPFAVCLAQRLVDAPDGPLVPAACRLAAECLARPEADPGDWAMAAAVIADFGTPDQQRQLLALLQSEPHGRPPSPRYQAAAAGATNRYTRNRMAYLRPLLADLRSRPETAARRYRYADTAVARLTSILNVDFLGQHEAADRAAWDRAIRAAGRWFAGHPDAAAPWRLELPPPPSAPR